MSGKSTPTGSAGRETPAEPVQGIKITDKRKVDPHTGSVREPVAREPVVSGPPVDVPVSALIEEQLADSEQLAPTEQTAAEVQDARVAELTTDLQRMAAEYANYRKRVERDRVATHELAVIAVLAELLPVLDDIELAREYKELEGAFKSVADALLATTRKLGLETYGKVDDPFDPELHEALTHVEAEGLTGPVITEVYQPGFRFKSRVVRPARVAVAE